MFGRTTVPKRNLFYAPRVVPALCIVYSTLLFLSRRCTAATSLETEAEGVPMGMRQKSVCSLLKKIVNSDILPVRIHV